MTPIPFTPEAIAVLKRQHVRRLDIPDVCHACAEEWPCTVAKLLVTIAPAPLQASVREWMLACFGPEIAADKTERTWRFIEEALELAQAQGASSSDVCTLVDYVFARPVGDARQEVGGVLLTLAALCGAVGLDMDRAGEDELARVWVKIEVIREKQRTKPHGSPLPQRLCDCSADAYNARFGNEEPPLPHALNCPARGEARS